MEKKNKDWLELLLWVFICFNSRDPCVAPPLAGALVYIGQTGDAVLGGMAPFVMSLGMGMPLLIIGLQVQVNLCQNQVVGWKELQNLWNCNARSCYLVT